MANINYDLCNDSSLISQLKLLVNQFLIVHLICTHKSHVKSCFDSMHFFSCEFLLSPWSAQKHLLGIHMCCYIRG